MDKEKKVQLPFKLVPLADQKKYISAVMAQLGRVKSNARSVEAQKNIQDKIDYYGSVFHSIQTLEKHKQLISTISKLKNYGYRFFKAIRRGKSTN